MKISFFRLFTAVAVFCGGIATAATTDEAAALEARLDEVVASSPEGAELMLRLIDLHGDEGRVFGLIRTAGEFSRTQRDHPRRAEVTHRLIEGYVAAARHEDVITTGRQFLELFPESKFGNAVRERVATAHELRGQNALAAAALEEAWSRGGPLANGIRALELRLVANDAAGFDAAAALASAMVEKSPADETLVEIAFRGLEAARRSEQWDRGLAIAKAVWRRDPPMAPAERRELRFRHGECQSRLGQHENAIVSFREAAAGGHPDAHRSLVEAMIRAAKPPVEIEAEARRYLAAHPRRDDRRDPLARAAHAAAAAEDSFRAVALAGEIIRHDATLHDLPRALVRWCGGDPGRAERELREAIAANPDDGARLRAVLALDLYRERMEATAKARAAAREFLARSPADDGATAEVVGFLWRSAPGDEAFREDLDAVAASAREFPHREGFQEQVWKPAPAEPERRRTWETAKKAHLNDPVTRLWVQTRERGGKSGQACKKLLQREWPDEIRRHLLARLATVYRHHLGGKSREVSATHFRTLCQAFPEDFSAAVLWLEAAGHADAEMRIEAARHLLGFPPAETHPDTWVRLVETKDEAIVRRAIPWIREASEIDPHGLSQSARIGDLLDELGMEREALDWWRSRMDRMPDTREAVTCALRVASKLEPGSARELLRPRFEADTAFHGAYAAAIADLDFRAGDLDAMEEILARSRARADARPLRSWGMNEWPARGWLETARKADDWPPEKRARVFNMIRDLRLGRLSAEAGMERLAERPPGVDRQLDAQELILMAERHHESWKRLYPFAQSAVARGDFPLAAAILNGLLNSLRSVGETEIAEARALLRQAYANLGGLGADIPADSPIAPLLRIVLHLRLGETALAEQAYYEHRELFDAHRDDLPVELLAFAAETHIAQGTPEDHERAEDLLRGWIMKFGEEERVDVRDKARMQLLLARNFQRASRFDVARAEFTTVLNVYGDQPEAVEARFGIGETYMAQKIYDQAGDIFADLAENSTPATAMRARFLLGVLALRQEGHERAREIFLSILEAAPDAALANETLYNLAEVYGIEQRFLTQLETLRTVGRLGQESKRWQTPGHALPIIVQDPDLGISRGDTRIPVVVRTDPGGDVEKSFLSSGGAGKGIFLTEIPTALGEAEPGDGVLQVTGADVIRVDYPEDFKAQFQFEFLGTTELRIASDGELRVASGEIRDDAEDSFTETLKREIAEDEPRPRAIVRPADQIKPGNPIHIRVRDGDRDRSAEPDRVSVKLAASGGDEVRAELVEDGRHGGVFRGTVRTGELPAGAAASDTALDHSPLMAIDHDPRSAWRSEPDGAAPKSLAIDMKELREVGEIALTSPDAEREAPVRMVVRGSHDGRFEYTLAEFPSPPVAEPIDFGEPGMHLRTYRIAAQDLRDDYRWEQIAAMAKKLEATETSKVDALSWQAPDGGSDAYLLLWTGAFVQERAGAVRFSVPGRTTALAFDGRLRLAPGEGGRVVDVFAERGVHHLAVFSVVTPEQSSVEVLRARENRRTSSVSPRPFVAGDFEADAELPEIGDAPDPVIEREENRWTLTMRPRELRYIEFEFREYRGEAVAASHVEISGGGERHIPPPEDVLELADNDILELAPGDAVEVSYLDEITAGGARRNRMLTESLTATYHNGTITPIGYDFARRGDGGVGGTRKELLRVEPGERIVAEVVDFDLDTGLDRDTVEVEVRVNGEPPITVEATETGGSTGVFLAEIETAAEPGGERIAVAAGDAIDLRYRDAQNTFPGHAVAREAVVFVNEPTDGLVRILDSETPVEGEPRIVPASGPGDAGRVGRVDYALPLTVEVIDPDRAKDSRSTVTVEVATDRGANVLVECELSRAFAASDELAEDYPIPALFEGRFVGQVPLFLGDAGGDGFAPADGSVEPAALGRVRSPAAAPEDNGEVADGMRVLHVTGGDTIIARYEDRARTTGEAVRHESRAALASAAALRITDEEYRDDAETVHVGQKLFLLLTDPDLDVSAERDRALVRIRTESGEDETLELEETLSHSGVFSGSFPLVSTAEPVAGNSQGEIECFFGDGITVGYLDNVAHTPDGLEIIERTIPVAVGTDGEMAVFSKRFKDEDLAIRTQFHIAESYFELFKGHRKLENDDKAGLALDAGRRVLRELREDYPDPEYEPRIAYLLGQFAQEMKHWDEAIAAYGTIVRHHPEHNLAPDAQYKLGQCHEEAGELDAALEAYVTLAGTYPKSPLVANVMLRINEHFYVKEEFAVAAAVGEKFVERFPTHEWAPKMAFRIGQCHFKLEDFVRGGEAFDRFVKRFPERELTPQALFWAGESYRMADDIPQAFRRYNRCRWDFPESEAAKYSRGRLALPELLAQFEREANLNE
jgi:TolA-binding protein